MWHLATTYWYEIALPKIGLKSVTERTRPARMTRFSHRFRVLAVRLGGLMIKLGQYLSTRLDVLPPELTKGLAGLQDEVPPVDFAAMRELAEAELGSSLEAVYEGFDERPIAAASLGQAYKARLKADDARAAGFADVVVKIQRPGIGGIVAVDLEALRTVARRLSKFRLINSRADVPALMEEFARTSLEEVDYLMEGAHAERFAGLFEGQDHVRVPRVVWERSSRQVLTLEDVTAIKITDLDGLRAAGIDPAEVAPVFASIMFDQFFEHGFFHGDPHPGNLFVTPGDGGAPWRVTFIDFGMMGEIPTSLRSQLRALIIAIAGRDGKAMVAAMSSAGVLLPTADADALERVMSQLFARFGGMGFAELREVDPRLFRDFAIEFSDVILSLPFQLPENFLLLMRAASLTSGLCSSLDPAYNLWDSVEPYAAQLLRDEGGNLAADFGRQAVSVAGLAWRLPGRVDELISRAEAGKLAVSSPRTEFAVRQVEKSVSRLVFAVICGALLIAGALVRPDDATLGNVLMIASAVPGLVAVWGRRR